MSTNQPIDIDDTLRGSVLTEARALAESRPHWSAFYRQVFGPQGIVARCYPDQESREEFARTTEYWELKKLLGALCGPASGRPTRVITVRMPPDVHEALKAEAMEKKISLNSLALAKLLQALTSDELLEALPEEG